MKRFSLHELIYLALLAALSVIAKPYTAALANSLTGYFSLPGGVIGGVFYMAWLVIAILIVPNFGAGTLFALLQSLLFFLIGFGQKYGPLGIIIYTLPGLAADFVFLLTGRHRAIGALLAGGAANVVGAFFSGKMMFHLSWPALFFALFLSFLSGGLGGYLAHAIYLLLKRRSIFLYLQHKKSQ